MSIISGLKKSRYSCSAVILAAGSSTRFGEEDKLFADLAGAPVLSYSLRAFDSCDYVSEIVLVADSEALERAALLAQEYSIEKLTKVVCGGSTRHLSALSGVSETDPKSRLIAIHDAARPLVSGRLIAEAIQNAKLYKAAVPALVLNDTVKQVKDGQVSATLDRNTIYAAQTPQVFDRDWINVALSKALRDNTPITDDASAVEALGKKVRICQGEAQNIKITTPFDLKLAESLLRAGVEL